MLFINENNLTIKVRAAVNTVIYFLKPKVVDFQHVRLLVVNPESSCETISFPSRLRLEFLKNAFVDIKNFRPGTTRLTFVAPFHVHSRRKGVTAGALSLLDFAL